MKTAIATDIDSLESTISEHFGQSAFFLIYDNERNAIEFIENPAKGLSGCVGETIVRHLAEMKVKRVIAGDFGTLVQQLLNAHRMQMVLYSGDPDSVKNIITLMNHKK